MKNAAMKNKSTRSQRTGTIGCLSAVCALFLLVLAVMPGCKSSKGENRNPVSIEEACLTYGGGNEIGRWRHINRPQWEEEYRDGYNFTYIEGRLSSREPYRVVATSRIETTDRDGRVWYKCFEQNGNRMRTGTPNIGDIQWERV
jgi:hypothetical protein